MTEVNPVSVDKCKTLDSKKWLVYGKSLKGAIHSRSGYSNQDSIQWKQSDVSNTIIMSIADGHGSDMHFRSKVGAQFAVKTAVETLFELFHNQPLEINNVSQVKDIIRYSIPRLLVHNWMDRVQNHVEKHPFSKNEIDLILKNKGSLILEKIINNPKIAYGSTLLTAVITKNYFIFFQLGDGNILIVDNDKNVRNMFSTRNNDLDEKPSIESIIHTESLCMDDSWLEFKTGIYDFHALKPKLILLSTDGYYNSFNNTSGFLKIGLDYLALLEELGYSYLSQNLYNILRQTSIEGSGDDITVGFMYHM
ncbi:MAG TPA: PP2C family serine/threonine-protein phosphatase [Nitrososphaeraceae archaeon]